MRVENRPAVGIVYIDMAVAVAMPFWAVILRGALFLLGALGPARGDDRDVTKDRRMMVDEQIVARGVKDERVLDAVRAVPRHLFVPESLRHEAYADRPLPIGHGQTISQPYIVALMTELLHLQPGDKVLEVGTGSGYQAAVLAQITTNVFTIEIVKALADEARARLSAVGFPSNHVVHGDGYAGLPDEAPFDGIIVTAAPDHIPKPLVDQLKPGGRLVLPVGENFGHQELKVVVKNADGSTATEDIISVRFVPFTGEGVRKAGK